MHTFSLKKKDGKERKYVFLYVTELEKQHIGCCLQVISDWGFFFEKAIERTDGSLYYYVVMERQPQIGDLLFYLGVADNQHFGASFLFEDRIVFTAPKYPKPFRLITNASSIAENDLEISKDMVAYLELNLPSKFSSEPNSWQHKP